MAMVSLFGVSLRNGAAVTAFSLASLSTSRSRGIPRVFAHRMFQRSSAQLNAPKTVCEATVATDLDLQRALDVTHPAYDVIDKDIVTEYGAYCTLYRHKKTGAELLSVANDDDNKVGKELRAVAYCQIGQFSSDSLLSLRYLVSLFVHQLMILLGFRIFSNIRFCVARASIPPRIHSCL